MTEVRMLKTTFKHIEDEFLRLVRYGRRMLWLERLIEVFRNLYFKVNDETRTFMRLKYLEGVSFEQASQETGFSVKELRKIHRLIIWASVEKLGLERDVDLRKIQTEMSRYIPSNVRLEVEGRSGNVCVRCGSDQNLHFHHVEHYAEGGSHDAENLMILCASCHAEEHKGDKAYHLLKRMAGDHNVGS